MLTAPIPADETERLIELDKLDLLFGDGEPEFDRITRDLAKIFGSPAVMMNVIDRDRQYVKSHAGLPAGTIIEPVMCRKNSICGHVVGDNHMMVVEDLAADERFRDNPMVKAKGLRFYAGAPLRSESGQPLGALCVVDFKPRQMSQRDRQILELAADELMREVKLRKVTRELLDRNRTFERDMASARKVQRFLLPPARQQSGGLKLSHYYHPLDSIGGDFLDTRWRSDGSMVLLVADVSGHGASAALTSAMVKTIFQRAAAQVADPAQLLTAVESELSQAADTGQFVTAVAAIFDPSAHTASLASAGHPYPLLLRRGNAQLVEIENDLPLLIEPDQVYSRHTVLPLQQKDRVIFCTDGATEAADPTGNMLGAEGLCAMSAKTASAPVEDFPRELFNRIRAFADGKLRDDVALVCVELNSAVESSEGFTR